MNCIYFYNLSIDADTKFTIGLMEQRDLNFELLQVNPFHIEKDAVYIIFLPR